MDLTRKHVEGVFTKKAVFVEHQKSPVESKHKDIYGRFSSVYFPHVGDARLLFDDYSENKEGTRGLFKATYAMTLDNDEPFSLPFSFQVDWKGDKIERMELTTDFARLHRIIAEQSSPGDYEL